MTYQIWRKDAKLDEITADTEQQAANIFVRKINRTLIARKVPGSSISYDAWRKVGNNHSLTRVVTPFRVEGA